jgi:hypothetical protein
MYKKEWVHITSFTEINNELKLGRELEFTYSNQQYSITNNPNGWLFSKDESFFNNLQDLLDQCKIDGHSIEYLFNSQLVEDFTIF